MAESFKKTWEDESGHIPEMVGFGNVECGIEADYDSHVGLVFCMHSLASALCMHIHLGTSANYMHTRNIKC